MLQCRCVKMQPLAGGIEYQNIRAQTTRVVERPDGSGNNVGGLNRDRQLSVCSHKQRI